VDGTRRPVMTRRIPSVVETAHPRVWAWARDVDRARDAPRAERARGTRAMGTCASRCARATMAKSRRKIEALGETDRRARRRALMMTRVVVGRENGRGTTRRGD